MVKQIKVAMIPDDTRIIINYGYNDSDFIEIGREIEVYVPGEDIIDPDTKEVIGTFDLVKEKLEITDVYDNYSIARKIVEEERTNPFSIGLSSPMLRDKKYKTYKSFNVDVNDNLNIVLKDEPIKVGDLVKII